MKKVNFLLIGMVVIIIIATPLLFMVNANSGMPDDFIQLKRDVERGFLVNMCDVGYSYYSQPQFYPSYERTQEKAHDYTRWVVHGFGAYPGETGLTISGMKAGETIEVCTFVHSAFNSETFQGMKLGFIDTGIDIFSIRTEPKTILLYPTFPDIMEKFTYKIKIIIEAKEDIPAGEYTVNMIATAPDAATNNAYYNEMKQAVQDYYECPLWGVCDPDIVALRQKVYIQAGQFAPSNFYTIHITAN